jgi:hypothetical protein
LLILTIRQGTAAMPYPHRNRRGSTHRTLESVP